MTEPTRILLSGGQYDVKAADAKSKLPRFRIAAYSGDPIRLGGFYLPVVIDLSGMRAAGDSIPILRDHDISRPLGMATEINISAAGVELSGTLTGGDADSEAVKTHSKNGFRWQASIGAEIIRRELLAAGESVTVNNRTVTGPLVIARETVLRETSVVSVGADPRTSSQIAAMANFHDRYIPMSEPNQNISANFADDLQAEKIRLASLDSIAAGYLKEHPSKAAKIEELHAAAVAGNWDANKLDLELLRGMRFDGRISNVIRHTAAPDADVITASLCVSAGMPESFVGEHFDERVMNAAVSKQYRDFGIHGLFHHVIRAAGMHADGHRFTANTIKTAFEADRTLRASGFSTVGIPGILSNTANKSLINGYMQVPRTYPLWCKISSVVNFRAHTRYRMTSTAEFEKIGPAGEIKHGYIANEDEYTVQADTYGKMFALTRKDIINDDLGAFAELPMKLGRDAAIKQEKSAYELLLANTGSIFSSGHGNLLEAGSALDIASLGDAEEAFLDAVDLNGDPIMVVPKVLVVGTALKATARALMNSTDLQRDTSSTGGGLPTGNPFANQFTLVVTPWLNSQSLTNGSDTIWYLTASPADGLAIMQIGFLSGQSGAPIVETAETDFNTLGIQMRAYSDFGVGFMDYRAAVCCTGVS